MAAKTNDIDYKALAEKFKEQNKVLQMRIRNETRKVNRRTDEILKLEKENQNLRKKFNHLEQIVEKWITEKPENPEAKREIKQSEI